MTTKDNNIQATDIPENYIAALDIGSNSIHFVYGRIVDHQIQILHSEKYRVALAAGLNDENELSDEAMQRALDALLVLSETVQKLTPKNFRVVATFTLRQAKNTDVFLQKAAQVFPFDIEIISGHEEARLIYQGVAHYYQPKNKHLVIDIGGGSTECVIGEQYSTYVLASLEMGCISFTQKFFANGDINEQAFNHAILAAKQNFESIVKRFKRSGWQHVIGTSGTIKALVLWANDGQEPLQPLTFVHLNELKHQLIQYGHINAISTSALKDARKPVICGGLAILIAAMEMLDIEQLDYCAYSLREGVLYESFDSIKCHDIKDRTIQSLCQRFNIDKMQADEIENIALSLFDQIKRDWLLTSPSYRQLLSWACKVHEVGIDINPSGYHKHGSYILAHADLPGFNQEQQYTIAWLVGNQRKKINIEQPNWHLYSVNAIYKVLAILRLSVLLNQQRQLTDFPALTLSIIETELVVQFPEHWLDNKPLIHADIISEQTTLSKLGLNFRFA